MAYSRQTENYGLPLPLGTDKSTWLDTNEGFEAVDLALAGAIAKGATHDAAIEDLTTGLTSLGTTVAGHTTDIAALDSRMTAEETIGANATQAIAQLSEKVYDYEERTFTTAAECFAFLSSLEKRRLFNIIITSYTEDTGTIQAMTRDATGASTLTQTASTAKTETKIKFRLFYDGSDSVLFSAVTGLSNNDQKSLTTHSISISETGISFHQTTEVISYAQNAEVNYWRTANVSAITLYVPVAVADD